MTPTVIRRRPRDQKQPVALPHLGYLSQKMAGVRTKSAVILTIKSTPIVQAGLYT